MNSGQSRPSSNDRIVPVTTPTANSAIIAFDQRLASASSSESPRRRPSHSMNSTSAGNAIPKQTSGMWTANESACIWRASSRCSCSTGPSALARAESTSGLGRLRPYARAPAGPLDSAPEALDVVRPLMAAAVDEERGRSRHTALVRARHVLGDAPRVLVLHEVLVEALGVEPELLRVAHQRRRLKVFLI